MAAFTPFKKKAPAEMPAGQTPEQVREEVGYLPEEDVTNLGEEPANFLPNEPIPKKAAAFQQQQDEGQEEGAGLPEFLSYSQQGQKKQMPQYGRQQEKQQAPEVEPFEEALEDEGAAEQRGGGAENEEFAEEPEAEGEAEAGEALYEEAPEGEAEYQPVVQYSTKSAGAHKIATAAVEGLRRELESKIDALDDEIANLKKMEANVARMSEAMAGIEGKYADLSRKSAQLPEKTENEIESIRSSVDALNALLAKALPALIKEVRSLKSPST